MMPRTLYGDATPLACAKHNFFAYIPQAHQHPDFRACEQGLVLQMRPAAANYPADLRRSTRTRECTAALLWYGTTRYERAIRIFVYAWLQGNTLLEPAVP